MHAISEFTLRWNKYGVFISAFGNRTIVDLRPGRKTWGGRKTIARTLLESSPDGPRLLVDSCFIPHLWLWAWDINWNSGGAHTSVYSCFGLNNRRESEGSIPELSATLHGWMDPESECLDYGFVYIFSWRWPNSSFLSNSALNESERCKICISFLCVSAETAAVTLGSISLISLLTDEPPSFLHLYQPFVICITGGIFIHISPPMWIVDPYLCMWYMGLCL